MCNFAIDVNLLRLISISTHQTFSIHFNSGKALEASEFITDQTCVSPLVQDEWELPYANGGTSKCFKCHRNGRLYFRKSLRDELLHDSRHRAAYHKEFCLGFAIDNPYIVKYNKIVDTPEECSLYLDFIDGYNLVELLDVDAHYFDSNSRLARFASQVLDAMRYMHQRQIIHMDINPSNVMISRKSGDVKVVDLGFCYSDSYQDTVGTTQAYSASEVQNGNSDFDVRTDIYGFGRILQYISENSTANLNSSYKRVMAKCLAEDMAERYASVDEIVEVLFNKSRRTKLVSSAALLIFLTIFFFAFDAPRYIHRGLYGYDFADEEGVLYNVIDKDSMTCRVVGYRIELERNSDDYGNVVVPEVISYRDAFYNVAEMADSAFFGDSIISMLSVMSKKIVVGKACFSHTVNLQYVTFAGEAQLHESAFSYDYKLSTIDYPKNLRVIPHLCFFQNNAIQHLNLPEGIRTIDQDAFVDCRNLVDAHLPSTLETLGRGVFYACPNLEEVSIPAATKYIGMFCFMACPKLKRVYNYATTPQKVSSLFDDDARITVFVPHESVDKYRQAECWKDMDIQPLPNDKASLPQ